MSANSQLALAPRTPQPIARHEPPDIFKIGETLARSGYFQDAKDAAQAIVKILAGRELGIGDVAAMTGIYIVKGRVTLSANLMAALVKRSGRYNYRVVEMTDKKCEIEFFENGEACGRSSFTDADARAAGLGGDNWKRFPKNMLFARAMSNGVKFYCPDVSTAPIYTPDELGAQVDGESGEVIEAAPEPQAQTAHAEQAPQTQEDGTRRRELLEQVTVRCVELGYDLQKQAAARAKAAKMSDDEIRKKVIPSLDKLVEHKRGDEAAEREAKVRHIRDAFSQPPFNYSEGDITEYLAVHHNGTALENMTLDQLVSVMDEMEIQ